MPNTFDTAKDQNLFAEKPGVTIAGVDGNVVPRAAASTVIAVQNYLTGVRLPDTEVKDNNGSLSFTTPDDCPLVALSLNIASPTWEKGPFQSVESKVAGVTAASLVAQANTAANAAASSASSAASSASAAATSASNKVATTEVGKSIATLATEGDPDDIGRIPSTQMPTDVLDVAQAFKEGTIGGGTPYPVHWEFTGADLAAGKQGDWYDVIGNQVIASGPVIAITEGSAGTTALVTSGEKRPTGGSISEVYSAPSRPSLAAGQMKMRAAIPNTTTVEDGEFRPTIISAPPPPGGSSTPAGVLGQQSYNSAAATATTHSPPLPSGGTTGAIVLMFVACQAPTVTMSAAWTKRADQQSDPTTVQSRVTVWTADWTSSLAMGITLSASSPLAAHTVILSPVASGTPVTDLETRTDGNAHGASTTTPSKVATAAADIVYAFASIRYAANIDGHHVTTTSGPAGLTEVCDEVTTRAATTNVGLYVGKGSAVAAAATIPAATVTASGGTGALTGVTWCSGVLTVSRAPSTSGPVTVQITYYFKGA